MKQLPFDLVAVDLDGTIVDENNECPQEEIETIREIQKMGVTVAIATGRMYASSTKFWHAIGLTSPILCYNGAMIKHPANNFEWFHLPMPAYRAAEVMHFCEENKLHLNIYLEDIMRIHKETEWSDLYCGRTGSSFQVVGDVRQYVGKSPTKLIIVDSPEKTDELLIEFKARFGSTVNVTKSNEEYLEFMHPAANKAKTLARLAHRIGTTRERTLALGDGLNDMQMLKWAGTSVAMGQSRDELKQRCDIIAPNFEDHGAVRVLQQIFGL